MVSSTLALLVATPVLAAESTRLTIQMNRNLPVGQHPLVGVRLENAGRPVADATIQLRLNGRLERVLVTGRDGTAATTIQRDLSARTYTVEARFAGTTALNPAVQELQLVVEPVELTIATVPPLPATRLVAVDGGSPILTDEAGVAHIQVFEPGRREIKVFVPAEDEGRRFHLVRWGDRAEAVATRIVRVPDVRALTVAFELERSIKIEFDDPAGRSVDPTRVGLFEMANGRGETIEVDTTVGNWLPENRITRPASGLISEPIEYRIERVEVNGQNVVDRGRQRFTTDESTWRVAVLLFGIVIRGQDALLGTPAGGLAVLVHPDGHSEAITLDHTSVGSVEGLPRGDYRVSLSGELGLSPATPIALSRGQTVTVLLISGLDIGLVLTVGLVVGGALVLIGRPGILRAIAKRRAGPASRESRGRQAQETQVDGLDEASP